MGIPKHFYLQQSLIVDNISSLDENVIFKCVHCSGPTLPKLNKKLWAIHKLRQKKRKKVQTVRQVNANEVGDSQMMAISDEGVGVGVIQKLTIADRGGKRGL